jgi:putative flippase GtrA
VNGRAVELVRIELVRYALNGIAATGMHYGVLTFNLDVLHFSSAGLANLIAAVFGITTSFLGSRYFVFCDNGESIATQALKFSGLYGAIAALHGLVLFIWTDALTLDYRIGFLIATALQVSLGYLGNKFLVFKT